MQTQENIRKQPVLGLQHLLAMYSGSILVPIMIATALGYSAEQLTYLISTDILHCVEWQPSSNSNSTILWNWTPSRSLELPSSR